MSWIHHFTGHVGCGRHYRFYHGVDRLTGGSIPHVEQAILAGCGNSLDDFTIVSSYIKQHWSSDMIPVPQIVMHRLVIPGQFASLNIQCDGAVSE